MCKIAYKMMICTLIACAFSQLLQAQNDTIDDKSRLTIGGYGEAVYNYNFFSDNPNRYSHAADYKDAPGHGRVDLPHAVIMLGYNFGRGWSFGTEIEFEHGGTESAVEMEAEEAGEFEKEIERGGEVALEQFWLQKSFGSRLNIRAGHIVVPVGMTNSNHLPNQFFGVYRPEGENTILPCTWHETGISLWGLLGDWRYELQLLPALNSRMMNRSGWIHDASASAYEFRVANHLAGAARIDYRGVKNLRLSLSGYVGNSFNNDIRTDVYSESSRYAGVKGTVAVGAFDFDYDNGHIVVRGNADYGYLSDSYMITQQNLSQNHSTASPYPHDKVGKNAVALGLEAGVDVLHFGRSTHRQRLFLFAHGEYYDSFIPADNVLDDLSTSRTLLTAGVNYYPLPQIAIKAEGGIRLFDEAFNNEPWIAVGITWTGMFKR